VRTGRASGAALAVLAWVLSGACATAAGPAAAVAFPNYNTAPLPPDEAAMPRTAADLVPVLGTGLNIGNTLEAIGGETAWGNPAVSAEFLAFVRQSGFQSIRLPVSWDQYADRTTALISPSWLARVKTVVQQALDAGLAVVVNAHWDGGWLENHVTGADRAAVTARQTAYWQQIATAFRDFDDRVVFAGANEPNAKTEAQMEVLLAYHQAFVDAVRSTGGRNSHRVLVVQGPNTDIDLTLKLMNTLPSDPAAHRLMVEIHDYTPWNFTGMTQDESWGNQFFYWGAGNHSATDTAHNPTYGEEPTVDEAFARLKARFVDHGIPVIVGEFGAQKRTNLSGEALTLHLKSRVSYHGYLARKARELGLVPFVWDTGSLLDRRSLQVREPEVLAALLP